MITLMEALSARHLPAGHADRTAATTDQLTTLMRSSPGSRLRRTMRVLPLLLIGGSCALLALQESGGNTKPAVATGDCRTWDQAASQRVASLVGNESAAAQLRLDEALMQLRRARQFCRSGSTTVAERDYRALERAISGEATTSISRHRIEAGRQNID